MSTLPIASPAQALSISPEALEVANMYLATQNIQKAAIELDLTTEQVSAYLDRREVRAYIDNIFADYGLNNKFKIRDIMDTIITKKLQELDEAEVGSGKDIAELLALSHKMSMDVLDKQIQLEKVRASNAGVKTQVNMQVNGYGPDTKYGSLISKLLGVN